MYASPSSVRAVFVAVANATNEPTRLATGPTQQEGGRVAVRVAHNAPTASVFVGFDEGSVAVRPPAVAPSGGFELKSLAGEQVSETFYLAVGQVLLATTTAATPVRVSVHTYDDEVAEIRDEVGG